VNAGEDQHRNRIRCWRCPLLPPRVAKRMVHALRQRQRVRHLPNNEIQTGGGVR